MRPLLLPLAALVLVLGACGTQPAPGSAAASSEPTSAPTSSDGWTPSPEEIAHEEWLQGGPMATSMPTRTCVDHQPTEEELATTDPDDVDATSGLFWSSCFDPSQYPTTLACTPPPDLAEGESYVCFEYAKLTQRVVDDWNQFADAEDTAAARAQGVTLEEYRTQNPDRHADGSPVQTP